MNFLMVVNERTLQVEWIASVGDKRHKNKIYGI